MKLENDSSILSCRSISKRYQKSQVLKNISLSVANGEIVLVLGANGAGKSTLLRTLAGLIRADNGEVNFKGAKLHQKDFSKLGYVGHEALLYGTLSVEENLTLFKHLLRSQSELKEILEEFNLRELKNRLVQELSKGELLRTAIARAFLAKPELLILDEPSSALDERSSELLKKKVLLAAQCGSAVIVATHDLKRLLSIATRVIVLKAGEIERDSAKEGLKKDSVVSWYIEAQV